MQTRVFGRFGYQVSQLGFGAMRLPKREDGTVDFDRAVPLIRRAVELGVNYIDSHHFYHDGDSEVAIGRAIRGLRDRVYLQTKTPMYREVESEDVRWQWLETALEKLGTDYIDCYLAHSMNWERFQTDFDPFMKLARKAKDQGMIRHIGFSFHDTAEALEKIINTEAFDCMTVQYNMINRSLEQPIALAHEKGMGVVIMGPVGGGSLAAPSEEIAKLLPQQAKSSAEIALRFVLANPNVSVALSGMSTMEQLEENVAVADREVILSAEDYVRIREALDEKKRLSELYCTGCEYCLPCPNGVDIPRNFTLMNLHRIFGVTETAKERYKRLVAREESAAQCQECGECEPKCPQRIPIVAQLEEVVEALG
ncbi:MAG: aldo/keto reductase [Candidatus Latescibacterota bacterium]